MLVGRGGRLNTYLFISIQDEHGMFPGHYGAVEEEIVGTRFQLCLAAACPSDPDRRIGAREKDSPLYEVCRGRIVLFICFGSRSEDHQHYMKINIGQ